MLEFLTWTARVIAVLVAIGAGLWVFGPYEPVEAANAFDPNALPDDLDAYLAQSEALVPNLRPGTHKRIHWPLGGSTLPDQPDDWLRSRPIR